MTTTTSPALQTYTVRHTVRILTDITVQAPAGTSPDELDRLAWSQLPTEVTAGAEIDDVQIYSDDELIYEQNG